MHGDISSKSPGSCSKCGMKLVSTQPRSDSAAAPERASSTIAPARRATIPDAAVVDQDGRRLRFYSDLVKGKTVAINFVFTTCTTICPPLTATFRKVQQELGAKPETEASLISISVDPTTDVPERLKAFASKFDARPGWTFVTGSKPEIDLLLRSLGAYVPDKIDHTPVVLIINDRTGYWTRSYGLAPAGALVKAITEATARR
jgi:cytochrome oxidase Cu insertion factor (SCO1/SenC/PrrC family)